MIGLLLLGVLIGIGHHLCYNFLNGKPVGRYSQGWILRIATGAAFIVKVAFEISVGIAISQFQWYAFRRRSFKIGSLDKVFTLQSDLLSFFYKGFVDGRTFSLGHGGSDVGTGINLDPGSQPSCGNYQNALIRPTMPSPCV